MTTATATVLLLLLLLLLFTLTPNLLSFLSRQNPRPTLIVRLNAAVDQAEHSTKHNL